MERINIAEILKDCPKGMELDCIMCNGVKFIELDRNPNFPLRLSANNGYEFYLTKYGQVHNIEDAKCVIFPKGKTTWEGFHRPFKDGDILVHSQNQRFIMSIYHKKITELIIKTHCILLDKEEGLSVNKDICCYADSTRLATEEEKEKLFKAIKENGYKWNSETKTLEKLVEPKFKFGDKVRYKNNHDIVFTITNIDEDSYICGAKATFCSINDQDQYELVSTKFDINTLKPFDKVLTRTTNGDVWGADLFGWYKDGWFLCNGHIGFRQCIPYKENEHLLGTTNDCDEFYKTW